MYRIEVEGLPPTLNAFMGRMHWTKRKKLVDEWHDTFYWAIKEKLKGVKFERVKISVTQFCKTRVRDADNAVVSSKFFLDALVKAKKIPDDNYRHVSAVTLMTRKGQENKTVILITHA